MVFTFSTSDESENKAWVVFEGYGCIDNSIQRVNDAVVAAVHDDEFVFPALFFAKWVLVVGDCF